MSSKKASFSFFRKQNRSINDKNEAKKIHIVDNVNNWLKFGSGIAAIFAIGISCKKLGFGDIYKFVSKQRLKSRIKKNSIHKRIKKIIKYPRRRIINGKNYQWNMYENEGMLKKTIGYIPRSDDYTLPFIHFFDKKNHDGFMYIGGPSGKTDLMNHLKSRKEAVYPYLHLSFRGCFDKGRQPLEHVKNMIGVNEKDMKWSEITKTIVEPVFESLTEKNKKPVVIIEDFIPVGGLLDLIEDNSFEKSTKGEMRNVISSFLELYDKKLCSVIFLSSHNFHSLTKLAGLRNGRIQYEILEYIDKKDIKSHYNKTLKNSDEIKEIYSEDEIEYMINFIVEKFEGNLFDHFEFMRRHLNYKEKERKDKKDEKEGRKNFDTNNQIPSYSCIYDK